MKRFLIALLAVVCMIAAYLFAIMLEDPDRAKEDQWLVESVQTDLPALAAVTSQDEQALVRAFGAVVPTFSGVQTVSGTLRDTQYAGGRAYLLTFDMTLDGASLTLTCARPADAAPLLARDGMTLRVEQSLNVENVLDVLALPCVYASGGQERCLYFASEDAAYALYAAGMDEKTFLSLPGLATGTLGGY